MKFKQKAFMNKENEKKTKIYIAGFVILTIIPSIIIGARVVSESYFNQNVLRFIDENTQFQDIAVINKKINYSTDSTSIELTLYGDIMSDERINELRQKLQYYNLEETKLIIRQQKDNTGKLRDELNKDLKVSLLEDIYKKNEGALKDKDSKIKFLETELQKYRENNYPIDMLTNEIKVVFPDIKRFSFSSVIVSDIDSLKLDTIPTAITEWKVKNDNPIKFENWLKARLKLNNIKVVSIQAKN